METDYEFLNPINWGVKMLVQMVANHDHHEENLREKEILDLANLLESKILEVKAIYTDLAQLLETWYSICAISKMIARVESANSKLSEFDFCVIQQHLTIIGEHSKEYYIPLLTAFYRYCKRNGLYETAKVLCLLVRNFSETNVSESAEYAPLILENEFSLVLSIVQFNIGLKLHESQINLEMLECDKKLSEVLGQMKSKQYEIASCPSQISNFSDAEKLSKSLFEMFEKVQKESVLDLDKSSQLLDTTKIFLGLEKTEDKLAFIRGLSCKLLATFSDKLDVKCNLFRESLENFLRISSSDMDVLYVCHCFIDENYGILWKMLDSFSQTMEDDNDRTIITDELWEVSKQRLRYGEEYLRIVEDWTNNEAQLLVTLVNLIECSTNVIEDANITNKLIEKFVNYLKLLPNFSQFFRKQAGIDLDLQGLPDEQLTDIVVNFMDLQRDENESLDLQLE